MLGVFLALVFGTVDFSRWLYAIDATTEAARQAVRTAAVCSKEAPGVLRSVEFLPTGASGGTATVSYLPNGCCARQDPNGVCTVCTGVSVRLSGYALDPVSPFFAFESVDRATGHHLHVPGEHGQRRQPQQLLLMLKAMP